MNLWFFLFFYIERFPEIINKKSHQEIIFSDFILKTNNQDCWILTTSIKIVKLVSISKDGILNCQNVTELKDFYTKPLKSSYLNIFESKCELDSDITSYNISDIKSKLFACPKLDGSKVFFPLLHTYQEL